MADAEDLIRGMPDETPPPEIVLAAVRVFRYRAATVVTVAALIVIGVSAWLRWDSSRYQVDVRMAQAAYSGGTELLARTEVVRGVRLTLWDVASSESSVFARILAVDPAGARFSLGQPRVVIGGRPVAADRIEISGGGTCCKPSAGDLVIEFQKPEGTSDDAPMSIDLPILGPGSSVMGVAHFGL